MASARDPLESMLRAELSGPMLPGAQRVASEIRARHREAVVALLFYGSCLRRGTTEGVLDFYAIVHDYRSAYRGALPVLLGATLPPNVHYLELPAEDLRAKYALISLADFARQATPASVDCRIWSRFCQPARIAWACDDDTRAQVVGAVADSVLTLATHALAWAPGDQAERSLDLRSVWTRAFQETYRAELRSEQPASIEAIADADPERYAAVLLAALRVLAERGAIELRAVDANRATVAISPSRLARMRRAWRVRRPLTKALAIAGLLKTPLTFQGWLGYVVWKLERHSGTRIELTERQRRRPLVYGWPVIFRLLRSGVLR